MVKIDDELTFPFFSQLRGDKGNKGRGGGPGGGGGNSGDNDDGSNEIDDDSNESDDGPRGPPPMIPRLVVEVIARRIDQQLAECDAPGMRACAVDVAPYCKRIEFNTYMYDI